MSNIIDEKKVLNVAILTISDTRNFNSDSSGAWLGEAIQKDGHTQHTRDIVQDDIYLIRSTISKWIADPSIQVVITTGGTGFSGRDSTPEAITPILDKKIDGFGELFRQLSYQELGTSTIQSRAFAGLADSTIIFCLPGSTGACKTGWNKIIREQLNSLFEPCNFANIVGRKTHQ